VALFISTWLWGTKWPPVYAERLFAGIKRNLREDYRSVLITDQPGDGGADLVCRIGDLERPYLNRLGCLARIGMFDRLWQKRLRMKPGDRVVCIDIDAVITGNLDPLFQERGDSFRIMQGFNSTNPCPFNGSLWMFRAGERHDVWDDFGPDAHRKFNVPIHAIAPQVSRCCVLHASGRRLQEEDRQAAPDGARIVAFPGRNPNDHADREWIKDNWGERC
jgi:hypothetical protein